MVSLYRQIFEIPSGLLVPFSSADFGQDCVINFMFLVIIGQIGAIDVIFWSSFVRFTSLTSAFLSSLVMFTSLTSIFWSLTSYVGHHWLDLRH